MADSMFHQPVMGRRAFVGGTLAASSMAFLAACGKKGGDASGSESGSTLNFYINNPASTPTTSRRTRALRSSISSLTL